ncbi:PAS domain-containing protein [Paraburkholderia sp. GAS448]|uniref:PAS domain-containing protein n=1 Tax=Paraburkholderia sp. GAS448 TaxID=3035136 RepID=UPI003D250D99
MAHNLSDTKVFSGEIVSGVNSVVVVINRGGLIQRFNELAQKYTGYKEEDVIGQNAHDLFNVASGSS